MSGGIAVLFRHRKRNLSGGKIYTDGGGDADGRSAPHFQQIDGVPDVLLRSERKNLDAGRKPGLVDDDESVFFVVQRHGVIIKNRFLRADQRIVRLDGTDSVFHGAVIVCPALKLFLMKDQIFGKGQEDLLCRRPFLCIVNDSHIFIMSHAHDPADTFRSGVSGGVGENIPQIGSLKVFGLRQRFRHLLIIKTAEFFFKQINDLHDGAHTPAAEPCLLCRSVDGGVAVCPGKEKICDHISYVIPHWAEECELRIENKGMLLIDEYRSGVQIAVDQRLRLVHETEFEPGDGCFQGVVPVNLLLHKLSDRRENVIASVVIEHRFPEDQILGDVAELRIGKLPYERFPFLMVHDDIRGHQKSIYKKCTDLVRKLRIDLVVNESGPHHGVSHHVLHDHGAHHAVIQINLWHKPRAKRVLQF